MSQQNRRVEQNVEQQGVIRCAVCGESNPARYLQCSDCGARLAAAETRKLSPALAAVPVASPVTPNGSLTKSSKLNGSTANSSSEASSQATVSTVVLWPLWTTSDEQRLKSVLAGLTEFTPSRWVIGADRKSGIAVDEGRQKILVFEVVTGDAKPGTGDGKPGKGAGKDVVRRRILRYSDLIRSQVTEDGESLAKLHKTPDSATPHFKIESVALQLDLKGRGTHLTTDSMIVVNFLARAQERGSEAHRAALGKAQEWQKLLLTVAHLATMLGKKSKALI